MKQKGFSIVELCVSLVITAFTTMGTLALFVTGLESCQKVQTDINLSQPSSQAMRRISDAVRQSLNVWISQDGNTMYYTVPKVSGYTDPYTLERELVVPVTPEATVRSFTVSNGQVIDNFARRVLVDSVLSYDPDKNSTQYNKAYPPFQLTTIGSRKAISINLITSDLVDGKLRYARLKTSVVVQNIR